MRIVAGLSRKNCSPRIWDPESVLRIAVPSGHSFQSVRLGASDARRVVRSLRIGCQYAISY